MKRPLSFGFACLSLALVAAGCGGGGSSNDALAHKTPKQVLKAALAAGKASGSVHFEIVGKGSGQTETITGDASNKDSTETIASGAVDIQAEVVGTKAYVKGNTGGLQAEMGLSATVANTYAGKWLSITSTDSPYKGLTSAIRLAGTLSELQPSGHLTLTARTTRASTAVIGVRGGLPGATASSQKATATIYVATSSPNVPIVFDVEQPSSKESEIGTYSHWGKPVHLVAPTATVAFSSLPTS